jgi:hypothetical protein
MKVLFSSALVSVLAISGCAGSGPHSSGGAIYTAVKGPISATPMMKTAKEGTACSNTYLGMVATGDNSIEAAKEAGAIKKVATIDYTRFSILGVVYEKVCTVVKGS